MKPLLHRNLRPKIGSPKSQSPTRLGLILLGILLVLYDVTTSFADSVYSVDTSTDELVTIDTDTGFVTVVGSLGMDARDIDLTCDYNNFYCNR